MNNAQELIKTRPELFDGYDGIDRDEHRQGQFDNYQKTLIDSAPDYIKQAIADRVKSEQPA